MRNPMQCEEVLPPAAELPELSQETVAGYILEWWACVVAKTYDSTPDFQRNRQNFLRDVGALYHSDDAKAQFSSAWRWLADNSYIVEADQGGDFFKRTTKGQRITKHDQIPQPPAAPKLDLSSVPGFSAFTSENALVAHMQTCWHEAVQGYEGKAYLATVVMLGSLLEAALLAMVLKDPAQANKAKAAPKDKTSGKVLPYEDWYLSNFIVVAHECNWIKKSRHKFSTQLMEYRNYIHPRKAMMKPDHIDKGVAAICWQVTQETLSDLGIKT